MGVKTISQLIHELLMAKKWTIVKTVQRHSVWNYTPTIHDKRFILACLHLHKQVYMVNKFDTFYSNTNGCTFYLYI